MGSEEKNSAIWSLLPSFDPSQDDIKEYVAKVKFVDGICPKKDRNMLAPRLAMLCKGTAWHQVRSIKADQLTNPDTGVRSLLAALSSWEESAELNTFELFDKAIYRTTQKSDESTQSFVNRLDVAFEDVGPETTLKAIKAFVLLKQSNLGHEDKKKVLTMTNGAFDERAIEKAMRSLSTSVLTGSLQEKKKVYPTNYVEDPQDSPGDSVDHFGTDQSLYAAQGEDDEVPTELLEQLATTGDADALTVQGFEKELTELFQEIPDLHQALLSYQEARGRIVERKRNRGFWPIKGLSKSGKGSSSFGPKGFRKGGSKGKDELLNRIARTHCKRCGELGHWKAECPQRLKESQANVASASHEMEENEAAAQVLFEEIDSEAEVGFGIGFKSKSHMCFAEPKHFEPEPIVEALFAEEVIKQTQTFFAKRNRVFDSIVRKHNPQPMQQKPLLATGLTSKSGESLGFRTNGMAILDTGASRSVIGEDNLPMLLGQLPITVRDRVKDRASRVAFRFGNNQIEYSYKQIHIPIEFRKTRMWLIVEVVPKATPFLLSIQTMRQLGAVIDLQKSSCHLKALNRNIPLHEAKTGLLMIRMQDLCNPEPNVESIFGASCEKRVSSLDCLSDANSRRHDEHGEIDCGERDAEPQDPPSHPPQPGGNSGVRARGPAGPSGDDERTSDRSPVAKGEDRRTGIHDEAEHVTAKDRRRPRDPFRKRFGSLGSGSSCFPATDATSDYEWQIISRNHEIPGTNDASAESQVECSRKGKPSFVIDANTVGSKSGWTHCSWKPIANEPPADRRRVDNPSTDSRAKSGMDGHSNGSMGPKEGDLGKEAPRQDIRPGVRSGQPVCPMVPEPDQFIGCTNRRFRSLLPNSPPDGGTIASEPGVLEWEALAMDTQIVVETEFEAKLLKAIRAETNHKAFGKQVDLLEVYAQPNSRLSEEVIRQGGRAERFTIEHGDLSTFEGQMQLLRMISRLRPKNIWVAPECHPWCAWNRFNASRSIKGYEKIQQSRELSKQHLELCSLLCKIQVYHHRHFTMENPGTSDMWNQPEIKDILALTKTASLDQCRFGLIHPEDHRPLKKYTRLQTTSNSVVRSLDGRFCTKEHEHSQIAGSCKVHGSRMAVSRFAAFYPKIFARAAAKSILQEKGKSQIPLISEEDLCELFPAEGEEQPAKRARISSPREPKRKAAPEDTERVELTDPVWEEVFDWMQKKLPKSGSVEISLQEWPGSYLASLCSFEVKQIQAGKGMDRYLTSQTSSEMRKTICQCRKTKQVFDLGEENWTKQTLRNQRRTAMPSHIMISMFGTMVHEEPEGRKLDPVRSGESEAAVPPPFAIEPAPVEPSSKVSQEVEQIRAESQGPPVEVPAWSPQASNNPGPKYLALDSFQRSLIQRMHNNLGHPTAEKLAMHLKKLGFTQEVVDGAGDFLCQSCSERVPPKLTSPGKLKEPKEFNEVITLDGFEWKNSDGTKFYVIHVFDEATHFHLGRRCQRGTEEAERVIRETWMHWAGPPQVIVHDLAGEFVSQHWKDMLQQEGIQSVTSAAPWQRGRIERHGGTVKEMLSRIDNHTPIKSDKDFDYALEQCFQAKNSMSVAKGFSPEQAVLGRARRLPGSVCSDESTITHSLEESEETQSDLFQKKMSIRTEARKALLDADNSSAIRRALLRQ